MKRRELALLLVILCCFGFKVFGQDLPIIPVPVKYSVQPGNFPLAFGTKLSFASDRPDFVRAAEYWQEFLLQHIRFKLTEVAARASETNIIELRYTGDIMEPEGYRLAISADKILIEASTGRGIFYALQSIRQLMPPGIENKSNGLNPPYPIQCCTIEDFPRFQYRGLHLDVSRHFFKPATVKEYIDLLALQKMNTFHWHLTDDQGWRIEIKKYPKLTTIGSKRKQTIIGHASAQNPKYDGEIYSGFYTQDEIRDVIAYANSRFVTIIPEIEMPGHALAALASYPELGCSGGPYEVATTWGVFNDVFCPSDKTFTFLEGVIDEVAALFPGPYIHIGGDECPKTSWQNSKTAQEIMKKEGLKDEHELQSYFIRRMEKYINSKGKKIIGWDEILEGGLAPNATVMSWQGIDGGIAAAKSGHDAIMTPQSHCYFDHYQATGSDEPLAIGGFLPLEKVYSYEPIPESLSAEEAKHILGAQGNLWSEYFPEPTQLFYMAYPRSTALAEVLWSPKSSRNFDSFARRLPFFLQRLSQNRINYGNHINHVHYEVLPAEGGVKLALSTRDKSAEIRYSLNFDRPGPKSTLYVGPITLDKNTTVKANTFNSGKAQGAEMTVNFSLHKAAGKNIQVIDAPNPAYNLGGVKALSDGITGSNFRYGDDQWLGWNGKEIDATIDLGSTQNISKMVGRFFQANNSWIY
ncbi:MAG: family 20 glycosylhydrolase, partial [Saprospiraceae bacterium]